MYTTIKSYKSQPSKMMSSSGFSSGPQIASFGVPGYNSNTSTVNNLYGYTSSFGSAVGSKHAGHYTTLKKQTKIERYEHIQMPESAKMAAAQLAAKARSSKPSSDGRYYLPK
jgi:hypothetical protein